MAVRVVVAVEVEEIERVVEEERDVDRVGVSGIDLERVEDLGAEVRVQVELSGDVESDRGELAASVGEGPVEVPKEDGKLHDEWRVPEG